MCFFIKFVQNKYLCRKLILHYEVSNGKEQREDSSNNIQVWNDTKVSKTCFLYMYCLLADAYLNLKAI